MSRIGRWPIPIPENTEIKLKDGIITVKGPKGQLQRKVHPKVKVNVDNSEIVVAVSDNTKESKSLHGLFRVLIGNMVKGVTEGFEKSLEIVGVGYRAEIQGRNAIFNLGYSHPINYELPEGIEAKIDKSRVTVSGIDKELVGMTAAKIRSFRKPEPYKGKGIKYVDEVIRKKAGKAGAAA
jgi:large subunit ribosomal protein L6